MRVIAKKTLRDFWERHPDSAMQLRTWYKEVCKTNWNNPSAIKNEYASASILKGGRVVFNICGNKYRLVTDINYIRQWVFIRFIGTHDEYDDINAEKI